MFTLDFFIIIDHKFFMKINLDRLKEVLRYNPENGLFYWKVFILSGKDKKIINVSPGDIAGTTVKGYISIMIDGKAYQSHQLAWFYMTGTWCKKIDHRDQVKSNNKWDNLRPTTNSENQCNRGKTKSNRSGYKGVRRGKSGWEATIQKDNVSYHIGTFKTPEDAYQSYVQKAMQLHGDFVGVT